MRKLAKLVSAALLALALGTTAFAAPSNQTTGATATAATDADGKDVLSAIVVEELPATATEAVALKDADTLKATLESLGLKSEGMTAVDMKEAYTTGDVAFPVTITFEVAGAKEGAEGYVLHLKDGKAENVTVGIGNGTMTGKFDSLSPVVFVLKADAAATSADAKGPATGVPAAWTSVLAVIALLGMAVLAFTRKTAK